ARQYVAWVVMHVPYHNHGLERGLLFKLERELDKRHPGQACYANSPEAKYLHAGRHGLGTFLLQQPHLTLIALQRLRVLQLDVGLAAEPTVVTDRQDHRFTRDTE